MPRKPGEDPKPKVKWDEEDLRALSLAESISAQQGYVAMLKALKKHAAFADWCDEHEKTA